MGQILGMLILWGEGRGWATEIRDVYILGGVVPCGGLGVRHRVGNFNIGGGGPCGVGRPGVWGQLWGMLIS